MSRSYHAWRKTLTRSLGAANSDQRIYLGGPGESQSCTAIWDLPILALNMAIPPRIARPKPHFQKNKNRRRFTACGGQVGAPHELFARPPLSPLFHLYTLAPLYLRPQSGWSPRFCYWTLVVHKASRPPNRGHVDAHKKRRQTQYRRISRAVERVLELEATLRERRRPKDPNRLRPPLQLHSFKNGICP